MLKAEDTTATVLSENKVALRNMRLLSTPSSSGHARVTERGWKKMKDLRFFLWSFRSLLLSPQRSPEMRVMDYREVEFGCIPATSALLLLHFSLLYFYTYCSCLLQHAHTFSVFSKTLMTRCLWIRIEPKRSFISWFS